MTRSRQKRMIQGRLISLLWKVQALQQIEPGDFFIPSNLDVMEKRIKSCIALNEQDAQKEGK